MITKEQKKAIIKDLTDKLKKQKSVVFADYTGMTVNQVQKLRQQLRADGLDYQVAKKTLIDLCLKEVGLKDLSVKDLQGQISLTFSYQDEVAPAKILYNFSKENESLKILTGLVNNQVLSQEEIINLAQLPSRAELLAKLVGSISAPMSGLLNALEGNIKSLIYLLKNIKPETKANA